MVSSRDRSHSQRRDSVVSTIARTPPPAFLFPNQRCQRPDRLSATPLFFAGGRRRRLSSDRPLSCQSAFSGFCAAPWKPGFWPQKPPRAAEGLPSCVRSDSIEARENTHPSEKIKCLSASSFRSVVCAPSRAGGGYLVAVSVGVNRSFEPFATNPESPDHAEEGQPGELWSRNSVCVTTLSADARDVDLSIEISMVCTRETAFDWPAPEREAAI